MKLSSREVALIIVFTALSVTSNYLLAGIPNVVIMDTIVFVIGYCFGFSIGALTGAFSWTIYGFLNPYGFSLPIWVATMLSESLYSAFGSLAKRINLMGPKSKDGLGSVGVKLALLGFLSTFLYDFVTNAIFGLTFFGPTTASIYLALITGSYFALLHEISNAVFFFAGVIPLVTVLDRSH